MRKILLISLPLVILLWGASWAVDGYSGFDQKELKRLTEELEKNEQMRSLTKAIMPADHVPVATGDWYPTDILVDCPPGGVPEGEPDCGDNYLDEYNSGCNALDYDPPVEPPPFSMIACGDTICGRSGVYTFDASTHRDTDWYWLDTTDPADIEISVTADFPLQLLFFHDTGPQDCENYNYTSDVVDPGDTARISDRLLPGTYWIWIGPSEWNTDIWCDGNGPIGNEYVLWVTCELTPPCNEDMIIGDINSQLPFSDENQTTFGAVDDWDQTCLFAYDSGEDFIYQFTVSETVVLNVTLDPHETEWTAFLIDDFCPPDPSSCIAKSTSAAAVPHGIESLILQPGFYWLMVDTWSPPDSIPSYDLDIVEGQIVLALAETNNIPDCGVSNFGPLGEESNQGNTYGWNGNPPANFAGTFVMGNSPNAMFSYYNTGVTDCYEYTGVLGLDMSDTFHPTCRYNDSDVLGGVSIEYCGYGYTDPPEAGDIFVHKFTITNHSGAVLEDYYAGVYFDWDVVYPDPDTVIMDRANNAIYQGDTRTGPVYGLCLINTDEVNLRSLTAVSQWDYIYPGGGTPEGGWTMEALYALMSYDGDQVADSFYDDMSSLVSTGPHTLQDGESVAIEFAVIGAQNEDDVVSRAQYAATLDIPECDVEIPVGACCDDETAICEDDVLQTECDTRFAANTLCADLDPECGATGCEYTVGDVNGSSSYNGLDITYGVNYFKYGEPVPPCPDCPACNDWYYCGDVNGSCTYNGLDITYGVNYFKYGEPGPVFCGDCPPN